MRINKKNLLLPALIFVCVITTVSIYLYRLDAVDRATELTNQRLLDSVKEQSLTFDAKIDGQFAILETMVDSMPLSEIKDKRLLAARMQSVAKSSPFLNIGFAAPDGSAFLQNGKVVNVADRDYFQKAMSGKRGASMIASGKLGKAPRLVLAVPVIKGTEAIGVMYGSYDEARFKKLFIKEPFENEGISYICDSDGNIIIGSNSPKWLFADGMPFKNIKNFFTAYQQTQPMGKRTLEDVKNDFAAGRRGTYEYNIGSYSRYIIYEPLRRNDWFLINAIDGAAVKESIQASSLIPLALFLMISTGMFIIIVLIIKIEAKNRAVLEEEEARLRVSEQEYRIAAQQSNKFIIRYDIATKTAYRDFIAQQGFVFGDSPVMENIPQSHIDTGGVDPESAEEYIDFYKKIEHGAPEGVTVIRVRKQNGEPAYYRGEFTSIFDKHGKPQRSIISFHDITEERERELAYGLLRSSMAKLSKAHTMVFEYNMTRDAEENHSDVLPISKGNWKDKTFNEITEIVSKKYVQKDDALLYTIFMNKERLLASFYGGKNEVTGEFRMKTDVRENYRWAKLTIRMGEYPGTKEVKAFIIFEDIHDEKIKNILQEERLKEDQLTGVLNRAAFSERVAEIINAEPKAKHALIMIDLDNFKQINDTLGHIKGDEVLIEMAHGLESILRSGDAVGRIGGDEFMVCLKNIPSRSVTKKRAEYIRDMLIMDVAKDLQISGSLGIALYPDDGTTFEELYQNSDTAVYEAKHQGRSRYEFYSHAQNNTAQKQPAPPIDTSSYDEELREARRLKIEEIIAANEELMTKETKSGCSETIKELMIKNQSLEYKTLLLETALSHTDIYYWLYDIENGTAIQNERVMKQLGVPKIMHNYPQSLLETGLIAPEYHESFLQMHEKVKEGAKEAEILLCHSNGVFYRVRYTTIFDKQGKPIKAMGTAASIRL